MAKSKHPRRRRRVTAFTTFDPAPYLNQVAKSPVSPAPEPKKHAIDVATDQVRQEIHNIDVAINRIESAACKIHGSEGTDPQPGVRAEPASLMACLGELGRVVFQLHNTISRLEGNKN